MHVYLRSDDCVSTRGKHSDVILRKYVVKCVVTDIHLKCGEISGNRRIEVALRTNQVVTGFRQILGGCGKFLQIRCSAIFRSMNRVLAYILGHQCIE